MLLLFSLHSNPLMNLFQEEEKQTLASLKTLYSKRLFIGGLTIGLGALALMISLFVLPKKYQSEAIIYPTPSNSEDAMLENPSFGFEGHANQLLQVLQSNTLKERLIQRFDLINYYEIDTGNLAWYSKLSRQMDKDIEFERTPYSSVSITAETESPELSANVVNFIVDELNVILQEIFQANIQSTYTTIEQEYRQKEALVNTLLDSLIERKEVNTDIAIGHLERQMDITYKEIGRLKRRLSEMETQYAIYAYGEQVALLSNQVANASARYNHNKAQLEELKEVLGPKDTTILKMRGEMIGARKNADTARTQLEQLKSVQSEYSELNILLQRNLERYSELKLQKQQLENAYEPTIASVGLSRMQHDLEFAQEQMQHLQVRYEKARNKAENKLPSIYVISRGRPIYKKSSPSHSKNLLFGLLAGFVFSTGFVLLNARWQILKVKLKD